MSKISFIKSGDRKYNIDRCLSLIKSEITSGLKNAKRVVVKTSCVTDNVRLAATHAEALDAVLDFIKPYVKRQITLAEGVGVGDTLTAFKNFDYLRLQEKYDFSIVDLNTDDYGTIPLINSRGKKWNGQVAKTILNSDYLISVSPPKTHDAAIYTGAVENIAVGSLLRSIPTMSKAMNKFKESLGLPKNNKVLIHQGAKAINENIRTIYEKIPLKLAVLDAFEAMEGNGPVNGHMVPAHFAIASSDPIAADWLACRLMGIDIKDVEYLTLLGAGQDENFVIGDDWEKNIMKFKLHSNFEKNI
ncbi:MAG: DUF362 domain-containing protein [Patescibacteria group bacterium]